MLYMKSVQGLNYLIPPTFPYLIKIEKDEKRNFDIMHARVPTRFFWVVGSNQHSTLVLLRRYVSLCTGIYIRDFFRISASLHICSISI